MGDLVPSLIAGVGICCCVCPIGLGVLDMWYGEGEKTLRHYQVVSGRILGRLTCGESRSYLLNVCLPSHDVLLECVISKKVMLVDR